MCEQSEKFIRGVEIIIKELNRRSGADKYNKLKKNAIESFNIRLNHAEQRSCELEDKSDWKKRKRKKRHEENLC